MILAILMGLFAILSTKRKLKTKTAGIIWTVFGIAAIAYGFYILSAKEALKEIFPYKHYSIGGWIAILIGAIILVSMFLVLNKNEKGKD